MNTDKFFDLIRKKKAELAKEYDVDVSSIVYIEDNKFIVVKNGVEIRI